MSLDYNLCRSKAWLAALNAAILRMPRPHDPKEQDLLTGTAALLYPVETVTPEIALGEEIKVFLKDAPQTDKLQNNDQIILLSLLIREIEEAVNQFEKIWPKDLREADERAESMENLSRKLDKLWKAKEMYSNTGSVSEDIITPDGGGTILKIFQIENLLADNLPQKAIELSEEAEKSAEEKNGENWRYAIANAGSLRGRAHEMLNQLSLAEVAYTKSIEILQHLYPQSELLRNTLLARARLRESRKDIQGMCSDYHDACIAGSCINLSLARDRGICN